MKIKMTLVAATLWMVSACGGGSSHADGPSPQSPTPSASTSKEPEDHQSGDPVFLKENRCERHDQGTDNVKIDCCVDLSTLPKLEQNGVEKKDDGFVISGKTCSSLMFLGSTDLSADVTIEGVGTIYNLGESLARFAGKLSIKGNSVDQPTNFVNTTLLSKVTLPERLSLENVFFGSTVDGVEYSIDTLHAEMAMNAVKFLEVKNGLTISLGKRRAQTGADLKILSNAMETNFKYSFTKVEIIDSVNSLTESYPFTLDGIELKNKKQAQKPFVKLEGAYYGTKGVLKPYFPYVSEVGYLISQQAALSFAAGTVMKFKGSLLDVNNGRVEFNGTRENPVVLTSFRDDTGGDTNGDQISTTPKNRDWAGVRINNSQTRDKSIFSGVEVKYSGISIAAADAELKNVKIISGSTCADGNFAFYDYADCFYKSPFDASLFGYMSAKIKINGPLEIIHAPEDNILHGVALASHIASKGDLAFEQSPEGSIAMTGFHGNGRICLEMTPQAVKPFDVNNTSLVLAGVDQEGMISSATCSNR